MRSDWHRYNLKRRVAQLPPVDEATFRSKVSVHADGDATASEPNDRESKKEARRRAKESIREQKRHLLETARNSMVERSNIETLTNLQLELSEKSSVSQHEELFITQDNIDEDTSQGPSQEDLIREKLENKVDIPPTTCLFCQRKYGSNFATLDENLEHMRLKHGLFIPERKYLTDLEGLLQYLGEKIGFGNVCLCCLYQGKDIVAVRDHMLNKRHMKIPYESEDEKLEISDFYDFSSTYTSEVPEGVDDDWEDVVDASDDDDDDDEDFLGVTDAIYKDGLDLVLPSGAVLGNRAYARYYRQNLAPDRILSDGQGTVIAAESRHMLGFKDRKELATQKRAWVRAKKREDVNDRRAAKFINNQPHFRDPLLQ